MLNGKFKCTRGRRGITTSGVVYEFKDGTTFYDDETESACFTDVQEYNACCSSQIEPYIEQPKHLTNSQLWELTQQGKIQDGQLFELQEDCVDKSIAIFHDDEGEFRWKDGDGEVSFNREDKWILLSGKPRLTKAECEAQFGIEIID